MCPEDDELCELLEGRLEPDAVVRLDEHASRCAACRSLLAALAGASTPTQASLGSADTAPAARFVDEALRDAHADRRVGSVLGDKWTVERVLGAGATARVYQGRHRNGRRVAIKILRPELVVESKLLGRFMQEGLIANRVDHPGVVAVLDDGTTDDHAPYIVMELLDGETLRARLERAGPLPEGEVLRFADALLDVLVAAHARGILHRDLKPENLFVTKQGELKVLDFGIARWGERALHATETGVAVGTPAFMPPEQALGRWDVVDARSDLWSVGATMYALLTGSAPRRAANRGEQLLEAMTQPVPPMASVRAVVSAEVAAIVDRSLALEPSERFGDACMMQASVRAALAHRAAAPRASVLRRVESGAGPPESRRRSWAAIAGIGGLVVASAMAARMSSPNASVPVSPAVPAVASSSALPSAAASAGSAPSDTTAAAETTVSPPASPPAVVRAPAAFASAPLKQKRRGAHAPRRGAEAHADAVELEPPVPAAEDTTKVIFSSPAAPREALDRRL